jgi:hypothetical protein
MRTEPNVVIRENVCNQSARGGADLRLIVVHSTESLNVPDSARDLRGIANWFDDPSSQASSHVVTDADGQSARLVPDDRKAWTQAFYNPWCLSIEQIGRAAAGHWADAEVEESARWIAMWNERHGIPIRKGAVTRDGRITRSGVIRHSELGSLGGGHADPGADFPLAECLRIARRIARR